MIFHYFKINTNQIINLSEQPLPKRQRNYHEIMWLTKGNAQFIIDGDKYKIDSSSFFIFPKGRIHQFIPNKEVEGHVIRFSEDVISEFPRLLFSKFNQLSSIKINKTDAEEFKLLYKIFKLEYEKNIGILSPIKTNLLKVLIYKLNAIKKSQLPNYTAQNKNIDIFDQFQILLDKHIKDQEPIIFYSKKLNITSRKLNTVCKNVMNKSTSKVIAERLLIEAKKELIYTNKSISSIAYSLNFEDNSYFTKFIKKHLKTTPKELRNNFKM